MRKKKYHVTYRRKRQGKTNYKKRLRLLQAQKPRLVVRPSLKNMTVQIIDYDAKGDKTLISVSTSELAKLGWKFSLGNIPSAYLVGILAGKRAKDKKIESAILDVGMRQITKGSRISASLKGAVDAGLDIPHSKEILPDEKRLKGDHIEKYRKLDDVSKQVDEVKKKIMGA